MRFLPLTVEDRAIFDRLSVGSEFEARVSDALDYARTHSALKGFGSVVDSVVWHAEGHKALFRLQDARAAA